MARADESGVVNPAEQIFKLEEIDERTRARITRELQSARVLDDPLMTNVMVDAHRASKGLPSRIVLAGEVALPMPTAVDAGGAKIRQQLRERLNERLGLDGAEG